MIHVCMYEKEREGKREGEREVSVCVCVHVRAKQLCHRASVHQRTT